MTENPYQPSQILDPDLKHTVPVGEVDVVAAVPRYRGPAEVVRGELDESTAETIAASCKPIDIPREMVPSIPTTSKWRSNLIAIFLVAAIAVAFIWFDRQDRSTPTASGGSWASSIFFKTVAIAAIIATGSGLLLLVEKFARATKVDPPHSGCTELTLKTTGFSIRKQTLDQRQIEIHCSWRCTRFTQAPEGWLIHTAMQDAFLVAKSWMTPTQQANFQQLAYESTCWQSQQGPLNILEKVPEQAGESFPNYREGATPIHGNARIEFRARKRLIKPLRRLLPEYERSRRVRWIYTCVFWMVLLVGFILCALVVQSGSLSLLGLLIVVALPLCLIYGLIRWSSAKADRFEITGAIDRDSLWLDYRATLLRVELDSLPFRHRMDNSLILATANGSATYVLHQSFFESREAFEATLENVMAES